MTSQTASQATALRGARVEPPRQCAAAGLCARVRPSVRRAASKRRARPRPAMIRFAVYYFFLFATFAVAAPSLQLPLEGTRT